jgi:hypothetical protein
MLRICQPMRPVATNAAAVVGVPSVILAIAQIV